MLEGERENVCAVYERICRDPRHRDLLLLDFREIAERTFSGWSMSYVSATEETFQRLTKYSANGEFNPRAMSGEGVTRATVSLTELCEVKRRFRAHESSSTPANLNEVDAAARAAKG